MRIDRPVGRRHGASRSPTGVHHARAVAAVALAGGLASALVAAREKAPAWELRATETINEVPDAVATAMWPVMQLGTPLAALVTATAILVMARDRRCAAAAVVAGIGSWLLAKGVKQVFERGRPLSFLPKVDIREGSGTGWGFVSGHSAVAAACAVCLVAVLPAHLRFAPVAVAATVGIARIVHGVHLPADVIGGWALGVLVGLAALWLGSRFVPRVDRGSRPEHVTAASGSPTSDTA